MLGISGKKPVPESDSIPHSRLFQRMFLSLEAMPEKAVPITLFT
jgi:hypothetical protein